MNTAMKAGAIGTAVGFFVMVCILVFNERTPLVVHVLWPTRILTRGATGGGFWTLIFQFLAFASNALLYGLIGYGCGRWIEGRGSANGR